MIKLNSDYSLVILDDKFCLFKSCKIKLGVFQYENVACFTSILLLSRYCKKHIKTNSIKALNRKLSIIYGLLEDAKISRLDIVDYSLKWEKIDCGFECYKVMYNGKIIGYDLSQREAFKRGFTKFIMSLIENGYKLKAINELLEVEVFKKINTLKLYYKTKE